jgi:hypothetical protein
LDGIEKSRALTESQIAAVRCGLVVGWIDQQMRVVRSQTISIFGKRRFGTKSLDHENGSFGLDLQGLMTGSQTAFDGCKRF